MEGTRIVVGVDGSASSQEALRWAVAKGEALGAEVVAIHALGLLDRHAVMSPRRAAAGPPTGGLDHIPDGDDL